MLAFCLSNVLMLIAAQRVKAEKLDLICIPTSFQVRCMFTFCTALTTLTPAVPNCCCLKSPNPQFLIFDIRALWRSVVSARAPKCQKLKILKIVD